MASSLGETKTGLASAATHLKIARCCLIDAVPGHLGPLSLQIARKVTELEKDIQMIYDRLKSFERTI